MEENVWEAIFAVSEGKCDSVTAVLNLEQKWTRQSVHLSPQDLTFYSRGESYPTRISRSSLSCSAERIIDYSPHLSPFDTFLLCPVPSAWLGNIDKYCVANGAPIWVVQPSDAGTLNTGSAVPPAPQPNSLPVLESQLQLGGGHTVALHDHSGAEGSNASPARMGQELDANCPATGVPAGSFASVPETLLRQRPSFNLQFGEHPRTAHLDGSRSEDWGHISGATCMGVGASTLQEYGTLDWQLGERGTAGGADGNLGKVPTDVEGEQEVSDDETKSQGGCRGPPPEDDGFESAPAGDSLSEGQDRAEAAAVDEADMRKKRKRKRKKGIRGRRGQGVNDGLKSATPTPSRSPTPLASESAEEPMETNPNPAARLLQAEDPGYDSDVVLLDYDTFIKGTKAQRSHILEQFTSATPKVRTKVEVGIFFPVLRRRDFLVTHNSRRTQKTFKHFL